MKIITRLLKNRTCWILFLLVYGSLPFLQLVWLGNRAQRVELEEEEEEERSKAVRSVPTFFILGVTKAGTSSLSHHLHQHQLIQPALCVSTQDHYCSGKEVTFFVHSYYNSHGLRWYRSQFPEAAVSFDATPSYFYGINAVKRLQRYLQPTQKCIVMLRNPTARAYSQWQMQQRFLNGAAPPGVNVKESWKLEFKPLVENQISTIQNRCGQPPSEAYGAAADGYIRCVTTKVKHPLPHVFTGLYWVHLRRWWDVVDRGQLLILETDEFGAAPILNLNRVTDFLGLPRFHTYPDVSVRYNSATAYGSQYKQMSSAAHSLLNTFYAPHNKLLYQMLERRFPWDQLRGLQPPLQNDSFINPQMTTGGGAALPQFKMYVYPMPGWVFVDSSSSKWGYFYCSSERAYYWRLQHSASTVITDDPEQADLFFVPGYWTAAVFGDTGSKQRREEGRKLILSALDYVQQQWPFWKRHGGADHVFLFSYDYGICMDHRPHRSSESAAARQLQKRLQQCILLSTLGDVKSNCYTHHRDIVIPPMMKQPASRWGGLAFEQRSIHVHFRGRIDTGSRAEMWDAGEQPSHFASKHQHFSEGLRAEIYKKFRGRSGWLVEKAPLPYNSYLDELKQSRFCLCPRGHAAWTTRLWESIAYGCIPVIIADGIVLPFQNLFNWNELAVFIEQSELSNLPAILDGVTEDEALFLANNIVKHRHSLLFDPDGDQQSQDAFYWSLVQLGQRARGTLRFPSSRNLEYTVAAAINKET